MKKTALAAGMVLVFTGCVASQHGVADIKGTSPNSKLSGTAVFIQTSSGLKATLRIVNASPGKHGIHIHEKGDCADSGKAAGGHFNPGNVPHGFLPKDGAEHAHAGDMGNITIGENGSGSLELMLPELVLKEGPRAIDGRAVILHEKADDFGQPTGNAGGRIGCGVIQLKDNT